jgi:ribosomal 50S subunit-associated protein YjgA (DUF615 family)
VARFIEEFPGADPHKLRALVERAREEARVSKAPRGSRELFHMVNAIVQDHVRRQA